MDARLRFFDVVHRHDRHIFQKVTERRNSRAKDMEISRGSRGGSRDWHSQSRENLCHTSKRSGAQYSARIRSAFLQLVLP